MIVCLSVEKPLGYAIQFGAGFVRHVYSNLFVWIKFQLLYKTRGYTASLAEYMCIGRER